MKKNISKGFSQETIDIKIQEFLNNKGKLTAEQIATLHLIMNQIKNEDFEKYRLLESIRIKKG